MAEVAYEQMKADRGRYLTEPKERKLDWNLPTHGYVRSHLRTMDFFVLNSAICNRKNLVEGKDVNVPAT